MKIAVVSDTHSRSAAIAEALAVIAERDVKLILHCGDIEDAEAAQLFPANTYFVFGNCDADRDGIREAIKAQGATLLEPIGAVEFNNKRLGFVHGDDKGLLDTMIKSQGFDYVFHGHTHLAKDEQIGRTRVINPGALHRARPKTFVILDLTTGEIESVVVP